MNYAQTYVAQSVSTASPARLLIMLLDRLVLDVQRAVQSQEAGSHAEASQQLLHAQEIVLELRTSLRIDVWDGAAQLASIYDWLYSQLIKANVSRDVAVTKDCLSIIEPLVETWREAALLSVAG
jgi:flagellar protein FliS